uniref:Class I histocompatibility antigen, F10 alpha chain-like n=1 Tax=Callorhinchus milii TaxID=7868 RepID=A0A4W3GGB1_CALMI
IAAELFQTLVSGDGGLPEYSCALMLDDVEMYHYDSNSHRIISRIPSVQEAVGKQRIRIYVERLKANHMIVKENMLYMMKRRNISSGVHYGQAVYGCEVREDGTRVGQITIAFDGKDFLSFDKNDLRWISAVPEAQTLRRKLDNDRDRNQGGLSAELCVTVLPSPGRPDVSVSYRRDVGGRALLSCLVTGFYPRPIEVTWTRDGNTVHEVESSGVLPNHDHTFQTVKQMELETGSVGEQGFSCLVEHSSLQGVLEVPWGKINNNNSGLHSNLTRGSVSIGKLRRCRGRVDECEDLEVDLDECEDVFSDREPVAPGEGRGDGGDGVRCVERVVIRAVEFWMSWGLWIVRLGRPERRALE